MNSQISPQQVYDALKSLSDDGLQKVLEYIESIKAPKKRSDRSNAIKLGGILAKYGVDISENDIAEARKEMWQNLGKNV
ncbi:MAG: hypothetical protein ACE5HS_14065 [bacterium]